MLDTNHSSANRPETGIYETVPERIRSLGGRVLDLLEGEFSGIIRSHSRGEVYGGC